MLFRTAEGAKLFSAVAKCAVAFEADDHNVAEGWSVIVKVRAQVLTTDAGVREAERAQLLPWTATLKRHCVRVDPVGDHRPPLQVRSGTGPQPDLCLRGLVTQPAIALRACESPCAAY